jgi:hypothetical protein
MPTSTESQNGDHEPNASEVPASEEQATGCCGGPAPAGVEACCNLDAQLKADGGAGCGCAPRISPQNRARACC